MKSIATILFAMLSISSSAFAQHGPFSVFAGYGPMSLRIREAQRTNDTFWPNKTFYAKAYTAGGGMELGDRWILDAAFTRFIQEDKPGDLENGAFVYDLNGFKIPVMINYLERDRSKRFNVGAGIGIQYLHARFVRTGIQGGMPIEIMDDVKMNTIIPTARLFLQLRTIRNLDLGADLNFGFMVRLTTNESIMLRYTLRRKQGDPSTN